MAECKNIMVYVETAEGNPVKVGLEMLSPAKKLADKVTAVVIGGGVADAAKEVAKAGADQVICSGFSRISKRRKSRSCICRWNTGWKRYRTSCCSKM